MAMTKAEKEMMTKLELQLKLERALRWPQYEEPKPIGKDGIKSLLQATGARVVQGWFFNEHAMRVTHGCSNGLYHNWSDTENPNSQGCGRMYASRGDAIGALRYEITRQFARELLRLDELLLKEQEGERIESESA